jgi:tRNA(Ile)-lysidine synthase
VLVLRTPEPEDFIVINESGGRKKLSRLFTDFKLDRSKRGNVPVVADGNEIVWVVGMRLSERYKITDSTETIMEISYSG